MSSKEKWFASPAPMSVRFITALQITSLKYAHQKNNTHRILLALLEKKEDKLSSYQKYAITQYYFSGDLVEQIKNFFLETYNNEEAIIAYLNNQITIRYFKRNRKKGESNVDASVRNIINDHLSILLNP